MAQIEEIEAIKRLKYKYLRCVDTKNWDELARCFAPNATTSYAGGKYSLEGIEAIMEFLKKGLNYDRPTMHQVHHPEIDITGPTTAKGTWALQDYVIDVKRNTSSRSAAFYEDEYVKLDGEWRIKSTGYKYVFAEVWDRADVKSLRLIQNMFGSEAG